MTELDLKTARENMVEQQLRTWEVLNDQILETLESIPREAFTPQTYRNLAYADMQIPIGHGEVMLEPKVEGRMLRRSTHRPMTGYWRLAPAPGISPPVLRVWEGMSPVSSSIRNSSKRPKSIWNAKPLKMCGWRPAMPPEAGTMATTTMSLR